MKKLILFFFILQINFLFSAQMSDVVYLALTHPSCSKEILEKYISDGGNVNVRSPSTGHTFLYAAIRFANLDLVKCILEKNPDPNLPDSQTNRTPLILACAQGNIEIVKCLLNNKNKPDIDFRDQNNETALIHAARGGHIEIVKILLANNSNILLKNYPDKTAYDSAVERSEFYFKHFQETKNKSFLKMATEHKIIAKLIFDKFIEQNPDILCSEMLRNKNLFNIVSEYNLGLTEEETDASTKK